MTRVALLPILAALAVALVAGPAEAFPQFQKQFKITYLDAEGSTLPEVSKKEACFICHQGKKKKNRNAYGEALHAYLGKKDRKDTEKIIAALETVAGEPSDAETEGAPTFGDLIAEGKLPGGPIEQAKLEPDELESPGDE